MAKRYNIKFTSKKPAHGKRNNKKPDGKSFTGVVQSSGRGYAFITPDGGGADLFVPEKSVNGAYDGDEVRAVKVSGTKDEARIIEIIKRGTTRIVGTFESRFNKGYVYPDNTRLPTVFVPPTLTCGAKNGDKVVCEITAYPKGKAPGGKICEVLGEGGTLEAEELSIIREYDLPEEFNDEVLDEARISAKQPVVLDKRRDLRGKLIFTIDGEDTRDMDDGVSLEREGENYILGVHIADVGNYVKFKSPTDKEAFSRGTSVYFPDRVIPMLPKELSNGACSLNENEDRYALSVFMKFNAVGERLSYEVCESVIKSRHRTTYGQIDKILTGEEKGFSDLAPVCEDMKNLCLIMEERRKKDGLVNLEVAEAHIYLTGDGEIVIPPTERTISSRIIEQFMISANEAVADFLARRGAPCLYRIHENPAPDKTENLFAFLKSLGLTFNIDAENIKPRDFQHILYLAEKKPYYNTVNKVMLRAMQKARYSDENVGHFGLASPLYCHFTSPIRRYPDLFVHRVIKAILRGKSYIEYGENAKEAADSSSARERIADEAERKVDDLYKLAYMSERLGEEFDAVVSGVTKFGVFCELDNSIEGLIPVEDLPVDDYEFIEEKFLLKGYRNSFTLGDRIKIIVADCDLGRMKTIFALKNR